MSFKLIGIVCVLGLLVGCEKVLDIDGPAYKKVVVLTGLLRPDSLIQIKLTYSAPINTTTAYESILDAQATLYDNGQLVGELLHRGVGLYRINAYPKPGHVYRIVASVPNYGQVDAQERMPFRSASQFRVDTSASGNLNNNADFYLSWQGNEPATAQWLTFYTSKARLDWNDKKCEQYVNQAVPVDCKLVPVIRSSQEYIVSNSVDLDRFNGDYNSFSGKYTYFGFVRLDPGVVAGKPDILLFTTLNQIAPFKNRKNGEANTLDFFAAGPGYDTFLRSLIQTRRNQVTSSEDLLNNPFAEVTPVYTNVNGGMGVLGAINLQRHVF